MTGLIHIVMDEDLGDLWINPLQIQTVMDDLEGLSETGCIVELTRGQPGEIMQYGCTGAAFAALWERALTWQPGDPPVELNGRSDAPREAN